MALVAAELSVTISIEKLGAMVPSEARYSTEKVLRIMGIRNK